MSGLELRKPESSLVFARVLQQVTYAGRVYQFPLPTKRQVDEDYSLNEGPGGDNYPYYQNPLPKVETTDP